MKLKQVTLASTLITATLASALAERGFLPSWWTHGTLVLLRCPGWLRARILSLDFRRAKLTGASGTREEATSWDELRALVPSAARSSQTGSVRETASAGSAGLVAVDESFRPEF